jgi:hypothetical protein
VVQMGVEVQQLAAIRRACRQALAGENAPN